MLFDETCTKYDQAKHSLPRCIGTADIKTTLFTYYIFYQLVERLTGVIYAYSYRNEVVTWVRCRWHAVRI